MTAFGTAFLTWSPEVAAIVLTAIQPDGAITRAELSARCAFELVQRAVWTIKVNRWGYSKVYHLDGGARVWKEAGHPIEIAK
jgi:hypothetical protein